MPIEDLEDRLKLAYEMAWFIHRNSRVAFLIALEVLYRWEAVPPQGQRPLSKEQKFQRLIFEVSENFEKAIEAIRAGEEAQMLAQVSHLVKYLRHLESPEEPRTTQVRKYCSLLTLSATNLEDKTMMRHYLKHLALTALQHSYVKTTVSYTQLLYRYPTSETRDIYEYLETFLEKAGEVKDLQFFAKARREILDDLKKRFGQLLRIEACKAANGATTAKIAASSATLEQTEYAYECLRKFAPYDVSVSPNTPDFFENKGMFVSQVAYPEKFRSVLKEIGLAASPQPLFWPVFASAQTPDPPSAKKTYRPLRKREIRTALSFLKLNANRRKQWGGRLLEIAIDGNCSAYLNLDLAERITLPVECDSRTIEVLAPTNEGRILLAYYMLNEEELDPDFGCSKAVVPIGGGEKIVFEIQPGSERTQVTVSYQKPLPARIAQRVSKGFANFSSLPAIEWQGRSAILTPLNTMALGMLLLGTAFIALTLPPKEAGVKRTEKPVIASISSENFKNNSASNGTLGHPTSSPTPLSSPSDPKTICDFPEIYLKVTGRDSTLNQAIKAQLIRRLSSTPHSSRILTTPTAEQPAVLLISAEWQPGFLGMSTDTVVIDVGLFEHEKSDNAPAIWPRSTQGWQYKGDSGHVIDAIAQDLLDAIADCPN